MANMAKLFKKRSLGIYVKISLVLIISLKQVWAYEDSDIPTSQPLFGNMVNETPERGSGEKQNNEKLNVTNAETLREPWNTGTLDKRILQHPEGFEEDVARGSVLEDNLSESERAVLDLKLENIGGKDFNNQHHEAGWFFQRPKLNITVVPHINITSPSNVAKSDDEGPEISIEFRAGTHRLILDLRANRDLLASTYYERPHLQTRKGRLAEFPCEWQGVVRGLEEDSMVAISTCPVIRGIITAGGTELLVEAAPGSSSPEDLHQITSGIPEEPYVRSCGVSSQKNNWDNQAFNRSHLPAASSQTFRRRREASSRGYGSVWNDKNTRFIELVLVVDRKFYNDFKDDGNIYDRCRAIINIVNAIFRKIGVVVVLTDIEVWKSRDKISVVEDHTVTLERFSSYREELLRSKPGISNDNTVLITTVDFSGPTVGYAHVGGICSHSNSAAITQDKKGSAVGSIAQTIAHEIGHNLGMHHDDVPEDPSVPCQCNKCIMASQTSSIYRPDIGWSSCSKDTLARKINSVSFECLRNVPKTFYSKTCGNGVLDPGEQCDCGPNEYCKNPCCIADTCKLAVNATCASGACCNTETCHPHAAGRTCRERRGECDLPEFCSGTSESCPSDVHTRDGSSCGGGEGYCYAGTCGNPNARCKTVWGKGTVSKDARCQDLNMGGNEKGNCGWIGDRFNKLRKCSESSKACGTLQCKTPDDQEPVLQGLKYVYGTSGTCRYIHAKETMPSYYWLTPNGAPCGHNKESMCVNQQCRKIVISNGVEDCPKNCSNHGVCNSMGNCHCDAEYSPPDCVGRGHGGSFDSNFVDMRRLDLLEDGIFLLVAILIPIIACICCSWEKIHRWWNKEGYTPMSNSLPCCASCLNDCCCLCMSKITHWLVTVRPLKKEPNKREIQQVVESSEAATICQVSLDMKEESQTNSWGVADERLFTEVVRITPKNSPDLSRKIRIPSNSPMHHHKSVDALDSVPPFNQSVSVDSGCGSSDDDVSVHRPLSSHMSMTSLIGAFTRFGNKSVKTGSNREINQRAKGFGSQKSIPLSRYVVDPLAGNRTSRHGTPPPDNMRHSYNRSISTDPKILASVHLQGSIQPPSPALKPHKSDDNLHKISKVPKKRLSFFGKANSQDETTKSKNGSQETIKNPERAPILPPQQNGNATGENILARSAPPPPPPSSKKKPQKENPGPVIPPMKSSKNDKKQMPNATANDASGTPSKRPMMPPKFGSNSPSADQSNSPVKTPPTVSSKGGPVFPPKSKPPITLHSNTNSQSKGTPIMPPQNPTVTSGDNGRPNVKALAKRMEKQ